LDKQIDKNLYSPIVNYNLDTHIVEIEIHQELIKNIENKIEIEENIIAATDS